MASMADPTMLPVMDSGVMRITQTKPTVARSDPSHDFLLSLLAGRQPMIVGQLKDIVKAVAAPHRCLHAQLADKVLAGGAQC